MAIKKYFATKDNTITTAFRSNLVSRGTDANMGASDILEVFSIYGQAAATSGELARTIIGFSTNDILADRDAGKIPESGSVSFFLNLYNAPHGQTVPRGMQLQIAPLTTPWQEGSGLDMDEYKDTVVPGDEGSTWFLANNAESWTTAGGDYSTGSYSYTDLLNRGTENVSINITELVEAWISGSVLNYGLIVKMVDTQEPYDIVSNPSGSRQSYYIKKFFGRNSEFFFKRPTIEAKWDSSIKDDRGRMYTESNLLPSSVNNNSLYLYNIHNGTYYDIPGLTTGSSAMTVKLYDESGNNITTTTPALIYGERVSRGVYKATFSYTTTASIVQDRWTDNVFSSSFHTGSFNVQERSSQTYSTYPNYVTAMTNLRPVYHTHETPRFRFYIRQKDWSPTIYTIANSVNDTLTIESSSYQIYRIIDDLSVIPYDTGSTKSTEMSFDVSGNYFDFDMSVLEPGYSYGIKLAYYSDSVQSYIEQPEIWKFRVEKLGTQ
jgi:hypothetical protein